ncbi:MAG: Ig-like domain-containing protein, partial [Actinobacteria bacterium]|nr:Ig-like domain-containing protein [Actinomycetota bacterium]
YITLGRITANGGDATPIVELVGGNTVISVEDIAVTGITVTGEGGVTTITKGGGTLQMIATVLPANSKDPSVTWSVDNEAVATIDADGMLTAVANGDVTVTATANDGSGVTGELVVTVNIPGTTVWNPAANTESTGLWTEMANWTNGLPLVTSKVVLNVAGAADCVLDTDATIKQLVAGDNGAGDDVLRIADGGNLTTGTDWSSVAWSSDASLIVEKGGTVSFGGHFWASKDAHATVDIYGTLNVANMFGIAFEAAWTGSANVSVIDDGVLNLANIHATQSIPDGSLVDVSNDGVININGDHVAKVENYITLGRITAFGGAGTPVVELIDGVTVITGELEVTEITVTGEGGANTITKGGGTLQMTATIVPADATDPSVTWSVNDETIATIDADGLLTAVANGDVTVTATANDGSGVTGELVVTVNIPG